MKKLSSILAVMTLFAVQSVGYAAGENTKSKATADTEYENSTSHNPLTNTTTTTTKRKAKRKVKGSDGRDMTQEDTLEVKKKSADDGSKTSVTTEETHNTDKN